MKKYNSFILENAKTIMKYCAFDIDDNLLFLPTKIHMEHLVNDEWIPEDVSTEKFSKIRNDENWRSTKNSYLEFRDFGLRGENAFLEDLKTSINNGSYGPSWKKFIDCLVKGSIFAIITARGHEPDTIRKGIEYIIYNVLTQNDRDEMSANLIAFQDMFIQNFDIMRDISFNTLLSAYLDKCDFVGVSSGSFSKKYNEIDVSNPEIGKKIALNEFINRINTYGKQIGGHVKLGFSDDDIKNINYVKKHFNEISSNYDNMSFSVIDTSNPNVQGGIKNKI